MKNPIPETAILRGVLYLLRLRGIFAWRNNSGAVTMEAAGGGRRRFIRYGHVGSADILGILPDGRFLALECKAEHGRITAAQAEFLREIQDRGGVAGVVRSVEEADRLLKEEKCPS